MSDHLLLMAGNLEKHLGLLQDRCSVHRWYNADDRDPVRSNSILERIPAGRWGEGEDFAGPVVFLAAAASNYIHGSIVTVDDGWMGR